MSPTTSHKFVIIGKEGIADELLLLLTPDEEEDADEEITEAGIEEDADNEDVKFDKELVEVAREIEDVASFTEKSSIAVLKIWSAFCACFCFSLMEWLTCHEG